MEDELKPTDSDSAENRMALGIAAGLPIGVALSLVLDNWGMLGVGIALGAAFGATGRSKGHACAGGGGEPQA
jgi:hypothetical protein